MKRFLIITAAMLAFMSCTKDIQEINQGAKLEGTAFVAGQEVTICCGNPQTKVSGTENSDKTISFLWETGDKIKVTVSGVSSTFTLQSGAGTKTATFVGTMPASGTTFDIQYPETDPDLSTQTYSEGKLPAGKMKFTASDCTLESTATLTAAYAALRLNLCGYEREITQIAINNTTASESYTLTCSPAVQVGADSEHATPFLIVVPTGTYSFKAVLTSNDITGAVGPIATYQTHGVGTKITATRIGTTSSKSFSAGVVYILPATSITTIWAPVNCGYDDSHKYGLLYQWGRQYGQAYEVGTLALTTMTKSDDTEANKDKYGKSNSTDYNWFSEGIDDSLWNGGAKGTKDPCPSGWRVPTMFELDILVGGDGTGTESFGLSGWDDSKKGSWFNGTASPASGSGVFLPANGFREYTNGGAVDRDNYGYYWSSSSNGNPIWRLRFIKNDNETQVRGTGSRARGYSVRCVYDGSKSLPGEFSISATKKVKFSQGNLQYQASTNTWRFADHQWDFVGDSSVGNVYEGGVKCDNSKASSTYSGWIDLFSWGTSGQSHGAILYEPWSTSYNNSDFYAYGNSSKNLCDNTGAADWGYNAIVNGGSTVDYGWRTLTNEEWQYLFNSGSYQSEARAGLYAYGVTVVGMKNCVILYPDGYAGTKVSNGDTSSYDTAEEWSVAEANGVVCFSSAGGKAADNTVHNANVSGRYWSSTCKSESEAYRLDFAGSSVTPAYSAERRICFSVRLVKDIN